MSDHPELLKQLALEVIDGIPLDAAKIYTDGSKGETNTTGSGILIELPGRVIKFQRRNADHASHQQEYSSPFSTAFGSAPYSSTVGPFSCRPSQKRSCGRPCEGGYQQSHVDPEDHMVLTSTEIYSRGGCCIPSAVLRLCTDLWTHGSGLVSLDQMGISPTTTTTKQFYQQELRHILTVLSQTTHELILFSTDSTVSKLIAILPHENFKKGGFHILDGCGSLEVKVTHWSLSCHESMPRAAEDLLLHIKSVESQTSSRLCGVEVIRGVPDQVPSTSLT
ncbi:hypothetical protein TNCV_2849711 [Trichonephila clavipes]|nr:hypothetical protein TNCV_2849711 [Trichonephila clavipes]